MILKKVVDPYGFVGPSDFILGGPRVVLPCMVSWQHSDLFHGEIGGDNKLVRDSANGSSVVTKSEWQHSI